MTSSLYALNFGIMYIQTARASIKILRLHISQVLGKILWVKMPLLRMEKNTGKNAAAFYYSRFKKKIPYLFDNFFSVLCLNTSCDY